MNAVHYDIFRQQYREFVCGYGNLAAVGQVEHGDRRAPVTLAGKEPVTQLVSDRGLAETFLLQPSADLLLGLWNRQIIDEQGELIVQLFGARKPGVPEREDWRALAEAAPAREL